MFCVFPDAAAGTVSTALVSEGPVDAVPFGQKKEQGKSAGPKANSHRGKHHLMPALSKKPLRGPLATALASCCGTGNGNVTAPFDLPASIAVL